MSGENIIQRKDTEFLCPICRRLANALLPVVQQASYSGMLQLTNINQSVHAQTTIMEKFWETWKNLRGAIEQFAGQVSTIISSHLHYLSKSLLMFT